MSSGSDSHDLITAIKDIALELGRSPTRGEFEARVKGANYKINRFGGFTVLLKAAGLETYDDRRSGKKIDASIWKKDIEKHLEEYQPRAREEIPSDLPTLAILSDIHWPFHSQRVIDRFLDYVAEMKPDYVIINGDAWDMYAHSKYPRSHNVFVPREEQRLAREMNEAFWSQVKERSPGSKCYQLLGNHDIRPLKRVLESYPEAEDWIEEKLKQLFTFEGVTTIHDPREELKVDPDTFIFHGYRGKLGDHRDFTLMNCFNGHSHLGGTVFRNIRGKTLYECNSGYAGDPESKGLSYSAQKAIKSTPGFAARDKWGPRFIPA